MSDQQDAPTPAESPVDQSGDDASATPIVAHRRRRWLALGAALIVVVGACTTAVVATRGDDDKAVASSTEDSPLLEAPASTTATARKSTTTAATTTTTAVLPIPAAPPGNPREKVPVIPIGAIYIPKIGLQHTLYEGVSLTVLDRGPGHWPGTALPGQVGNTVFPGHRVTNSHPFLDLDLLAPGDQVIFQMSDADYVYSVVETKIVVPTDMWVIDQGQTSTFTLIACHPKHSARQRIVVKGDLIASIPKGNA